MSGEVFSRSPSLSCCSLALRHLTLCSVPAQAGEGASVPSPCSVWLGVFSSPAAVAAGEVGGSPHPFCLGLGLQLLSASSICFCQSGLSLCRFFQCLASSSFELDGGSVCFPSQLSSVSPGKSFLESEGSGHGCSL